MKCEQDSAKAAEDITTGHSSRSCYGKAWNRTRPCRQALRRGVNANMLFKWREEHLQAVP